MAQEQALHRLGIHPQFKGPVGHAVLPPRMPHDGAADARQPGLGRLRQMQRQHRLLAQLVQQQHHQAAVARARLPVQRHFGRRRHQLAQQRRDRQHAALRGQCAAAPGSTNTVRMRGSPLMRMPCATQAGTHTPRVGGTTQMPASVSTTITPEIA